MKLESFSLFLIFKLLQVTCDYTKSYYDYLDEGAIPLNQSRDGGYCAFEPKCSCIWNTQGFDFHCESHMHLNIFYVRKGFTSIEIECYEKSSEKHLQYNYYPLLDLEGPEALEVEFRGCAEPKKSYAAQIFPWSEHLSYIQHETEVSLPFISTLEINCGSRKEFTLENEHLNGLSRLRSLKIRCHALFELPSYLFQGNVPELLMLHIIDTRLEYIPKMLFYYLNNLKVLNLRNNWIKRIQRDDFHGIKSLQALYIDTNLFVFLDEDVFDFVKNLTRLQMYDTRSNRLPSSFSNLTNLSTLSICNSNLTQIKESDCKGLKKLFVLFFSSNKNARLHPQCFSYLKKTRKIDISGNSIEEFPERPIAMNNLKSFIFNDNAITSKLNIGQFLVSSVLEILKMSNSCIESLHQDFLHGLPNLEVFDISSNSISFIHEDFFRRNPKVRGIYLQGNNISRLPLNLFRRNPSLQSLNISSNVLTRIDSAIFESNVKLVSLDLSNNFITEIPINFSLGLHSIILLVLSNNSIGSLEKEFFHGIPNLQRLDFSYNKIEHLSKDVFSRYKANGSLNSSVVEGFHETFLPAANLKYINLSGNKIKYIQDGVFYYLHNLEFLNLSRNELRLLSNLPLITADQKLHSLDLSYNQLPYIPDELLKQAKYLAFLNLSGNKLFRFFLRWIYHLTSLREINLSHNNMHFFGNEKGDYIPRKPSYGSIKVLNLSNNKLSFNYSSWMYDGLRKTWGRISPFIQLTEIEEIHLYNNSIKTIFMDWRNEFPHLRLLDLRKNIFTYLTHQDQLFTHVKLQMNKSVVPYPCSHSLKVDLRENEIKAVELPRSMLKTLRRRNHTTGMYSHATILLDGNPYVCGCGLINFLRLLDDDIILTSELQRVERKNWVLPARIDVGNLSCWEPIQVRGKKLVEPETWIHHLLPLLGFCYLT